MGDGKDEITAETVKRLVDSKPFLDEEIVTVIVNSCEQSGCNDDLELAIQWASDVMLDYSLLENLKLGYVVLAGFDITTGEPSFSLTQKGMDHVERDLLHKK